MSDALLQQLAEFERIYVEQKRIFLSDGVISDAEQAQLSLIETLINSLRRGFTGEYPVCEDPPEDSTEETDTAPEPKRSISASVGDGGVNNPEDVATVQHLLNQHGATVEVTGDSDAATISAIRSFQSENFSWDPDGLVEVGKSTWEALSGRQDSTPPPGDPEPPKEQPEVVPPDNPEAPEDTGSYQYYSHPDWESSNYTLQEGSRTAKPLNATAARLLRNVLAGSKIKTAVVTSTFRTYADQAYIVLTCVTEDEAFKWYSWVRNNKDIFKGYADRLAKGEDRETIFSEYGAWIEKNVGLGASNHLSGIAIDVSGCDLAAFNKFAATLVPVTGTGVKKVFPETGRTHIEFTFKVC